MRWRAALPRPKFRSALGNSSRVAGGPRLRERRLLKRIAPICFSKGFIMVATYAVAFGAAAFAVISLFTWIYAVDHIELAGGGKPAHAGEYAAV